MYKRERKKGNDHRTNYKIILILSTIINSRSLTKIIHPRVLTNRKIRYFSFSSAKSITQIKNIFINYAKLYILRNLYF